MISANYFIVFEIITISVLICGIIYKMMDSVDYTLYKTRKDCIELGVLCLILVLFIVSISCTPFNYEYKYNEIGTFENSGDVWYINQYENGDKQYYKFYIDPCSLTSTSLNVDVNDVKISNNVNNYGYITYCRFIYFPDGIFEMYGEDIIYSLTVPRGSIYYEN